MTRTPNVSDRRASILMIDDERSDREITHIQLAQEGYHIRSASNGTDALRMIAEESPDLILLDVILPGRDGYEIAADIKKDPANRNTPVILITALNDREARLRGLASGADDFLSKPIDGAELRARIRNLLRLKAAYEELSLRNSEITAALAVARAAKEEAETANAAKGHFLRMMSHELRTPINAIGGYAEILELGVRGVLSTDQATDVGRIKRAASYVTRLISDVLTLERVELDRPFDLEPMSLDAALTAIDELCVMQAREAGLTLDVAMPPEDVRVFTDPERLKQILLNLVTNAIKFTPSGGRVEVTSVSSPSTVMVSVEDTGIGIHATKAESIFEPFVQIDPQRTPTGQRGMGLGLAISRQLARSMGGDLKLDRTGAGGSRFTLTLAAIPAVAANRVNAGAAPEHIQRA
jgi:signal transduction histidine kinase